MQVEYRPEHLTGEAGALVQREIMDRLGIIDWLDERLTDARNPERVTCPLADPEPRREFGWKTGVLQITRH
ncbi:MAG: hypothetical protein FKY71_16555 [Spiribacter salinus]|uniref:Uncharacterized protein n=1 Tax=Spiribacter salinus TaxID=1335746 RepID=A0A540VKN7_9GAMM|nr:MAG: hypothetical protein FKY71_16555 [Spiribacter salinus]